MEDGLHRRRAAEGIDERARVEVVPQGSRPIREPPGISAVREREIAFGVEVAYCARLSFKERGVRMELLGPERGLLAHAVHELAERWRRPPTSMPDPVRIYREDGVGARDPRTGAVVTTYKDVVKGRLDPILEAWRRRGASAPSRP